MKHLITYRFEELEPYINWLYFFHAWSLNGKPDTEQQRMKDEATQLLHQLADCYHVRAIVGLFPANSDGDDLVLGDGQHIPLLRQQHPSPGCSHTLCLADFVKPIELGETDCVGLFATSVDRGMEADVHDDIYMKMLHQTLADRLAEAAAEKLHYEVRTRLWGYAPDEPEDIGAMLACRYRGIRPAIGYPSLPDTSINFVLNRLLGFSDIGISLTQSGMMIPHSSVSGFMFAHPKAQYFDLGKIGDDQLADYARRRGIPRNIICKFLESSLLR